MGSDMRPSYLLARPAPEPGPARPGPRPARAGRVVPAQLSAPGPGSRWRARGQTCLSGGREGIWAGPAPATTPGAAVTGRSCMTDQIPPTAAAPGRRFRAYTVKHLDDLVAR